MNPKVAYDIITVGGGLGSAALARAMAEKGARVLVLERETRFKDRVRGEVMMPWGVFELCELGISDALTKTVAIEMPWFDLYIAGARIDHRDLPSTSVQRLPALNWVHNEMEEVLLQTTADAEAEVRRGMTVCSVQPRPAGGSRTRWPRRGTACAHRRVRRRKVIRCS
jgi:2-polyprenyl-6-methoxyphenol hydroxylase-like FAD-dependent oxidoreductase